MKLKFVPITCCLCQIAVLLTHVVSAASSPLYYGWFFNSEIAQGVDKITWQYLNEMCESVGNFSTFLKDISEQANISNPLKYYEKPLDPKTGTYDPLYHITAKYCGNTDCSAYTAQVAQFLEQGFETQMIGLFFTRRTYGIRIKLSEEQQAMFDEVHARIASSSTETDDRDNVGPSALMVPGIEFVPQEEDFHPTESRAHVTVGCGPKIPAVTTGTDLLEIIDLEKKKSMCKDYTLMSNDTVRQMGDDCDIFVVYPAFKMVTNTTFRAYYSNNANAIHRLSDMTLKWIWALFAPTMMLRRVGIL